MHYVKRNFCPPTNVLQAIGDELTATYDKLYGGVVVSHSVIENDRTVNFVVDAELPSINFATGEVRQTTCTVVIHGLDELKPTFTQAVVDELVVVETRVNRAVDELATMINELELDLKPLIGSKANNGPFYIFAMEVDFKNPHRVGMFVNQGRSFSVSLKPDVFSVNEVVFNRRLTKVVDELRVKLEKFYREATEPTE